MTTVISEAVVLKSAHSDLSGEHDSSHRDRRLILYGIRNAHRASQCKKMLYQYHPGGSCERNNGIAPS